MDSLSYKEIRITIKETIMATYDININAKDNTGSTLSGIQRRLTNLNKNGGGAVGGLTSKMALFATGAAVAAAAVFKLSSAAIDSTRQFQNLQNSLRLVTTGTQDLANQTDRLRTLAVQNRTSFASTVDLYSKLKISTEELGYSTGKVEELTTKLSQALQVSGADAGTAAGVIKQFGQAMASGTVRGDEFNSIVEGMGPALAIMARESGLSVGKLREMSQAGDLTAETFANLLLNSESLAESFNKMKPTIDQLETQFGDALDNMLVSLSSAIGLTDAWTGAIEGAISALNIITGALDAPVGKIEKAQQKLKELQEELDNTVINMGAFAMQGQDMGMAALEDAIDRVSDKAQAAQDAGDTAAEKMHNKEIARLEARKDMIHFAAINEQEAKYKLIKAQEDLIDKLIEEEAQLTSMSVMYAEYAKSRLGAEEAYTSELKTQKELLESQEEALRKQRNIQGVSRASYMADEEALVGAGLAEATARNAKVVQDEKDRLIEIRDDRIDALAEEEAAAMAGYATASTNSQKFYLAEKQRVKDARDEKINALAEQEAAVMKGYAKAAAAAQKNADDIAKVAQQNADDIASYWKKLSKDMSSSITKGIMDGKGLFNSFGSYLESWADRILNQIIEQMLIQPMINQMGSWLGGIGGQLGQSIGGGMTGGGFDLGSLISGGIGSLFSGFFANGGYIPSGQVGIAGEAGAELITGPANVTPLNGEMNSGGGQNVTININAIDTQSGTQFLIDHKREVEGIIHNAYSRRGKQGIYN